MAFLRDPWFWLLAFLRLQGWLLDRRFRKIEQADFSARGSRAENLNLWDIQGVTMNFEPIHTPVSA